MVTLSVSETTITLRRRVASDGSLNSWTVKGAIREQILDYIYPQQKNALANERLTVNVKNELFNKNE